MRRWGESFAKIFYIVITIFAVFVVCFVFFLDFQNSQLNQSRLRRVDFLGTWQLADHEPEKPLLAEENYEIEHAGQLILKGHFSEDIKENEQMFFYLRRISIEIYQNGSLIYSYGGEGSHLPFVRSGGNVWANFYSDGISSEDEIVIKFQNPYKNNSSRIYQLFLRRLYVGERMQLFWHIARAHIWAIISCLMIFLLGVVLLVTVVTLKIMQVGELDHLFDCGMLFLTSSLWILIEPAYITLLFPYGTALDVLDAVTFLSLPIMILHYERNFMVTGNKRVLGVLEYILLLNYAGYLLLQCTGIVDGEMTQEFFMFLLPAIMGVVTICLVLEIRQNPSRDARMVLGAGLILIIFGASGYTWYAITQVHGSVLYGVGLIVFALAQYGILMKETKENYEKSRKAQHLENELMENKIAIMLSQIQPHFLYNSLSSIQALCLSEPQKAHDALAQFAYFLRGNMDSLSSTNPIAFGQELRHVKNYLALEKIRFENRLSVNYEIEVEGFLIPALTIQPIAENAVRYGISKKKSGGTITIAAKEKEDGIYVTVADDGIGFDVQQGKNKKDGRSHIGMENVRKRVETQCSGRMEVVSRQGEGTVVTIILPKV